MIMKKKTSRSSRSASPAYISSAQKITPFLWFDTEAEEAAKFYVSIFPNSKIISVSHYGDSGPMPAGSVMTVQFQLAGLEFVGLNAGPDIKFTEAVSFCVHCSTQAQVDTYWKKLTKGGGKPGPCGWLKDKYGLSWQITPDALLELVTHPDQEKASRAMKAMMEMSKIDIRKIKQAVK